MHEPAAVKIALRIPGPWSHPKELIARLPAGYRLTPDTLFLPDETQVDFGAARADDQFAQIFRSSCRQPPMDDELAAVDAYQVNVFLSGLYEQTPIDEFGWKRPLQQISVADYLDNC